MWQPGLKTHKLISKEEKLIIKSRCFSPFIQDLGWSFLYKGLFLFLFQSSLEPNAVEPDLNVEKIACTSPGSNTEEELLTSELVKPSEASELETDNTELAADTGDHQKEERNVDEPPLNTVTGHEITTEAAEKEFKDQKNDISQEVSPVLLKITGRT